MLVHGGRTTATGPEEDARGERGVLYTEVERQRQILGRASEERGCVSSRRQNDSDRSWRGRQGREGVLVHGGRTTARGRQSREGVLVQGGRTTARGPGHEFKSVCYTEVEGW